MTCKSAMLSPPACFLSNCIHSLIPASIFQFGAHSPEVWDNPGVQGEDGKAHERSNYGYTIGKDKLGHKCRDEIPIPFVFPLVSLSHC